MDVNFLSVIIAGTGGFLGASGRYLLSVFTQSQFPESSYPIGTTLVNLLGCLIIGFIAGLVELKDWGNDEVRLFILVGFLGGFTTFSTFAYESFFLIEKGELLLGLLNIGFQVMFGLLLVWFGYSLVGKIAA